MSKGLGNKERLILKKLEETGGFYLTELLPDYYRKSEYCSLYRAMNSLVDKGLIEVYKEIYSSSSHFIIIKPNTFEQMKYKKNYSGWTKLKSLKTGKEIKSPERKTIIK